MQTKKIIAITIITILVVFYILSHISGVDINALAGSSNHMAKSFYHASLLHLIINAYALYRLYTSTLNTFSHAVIIPVCYTIATLAFCISNETAIGFSAFLYAFMTFIYMHNICWRNTIVMAFAIAFSFLPGIATCVHLLSIGIAIITYYIYSVIRYLFDNV